MPTKCGGIRKSRLRLVRPSVRPIVRFSSTQPDAHCLMSAAASYVVRYGFRRRVINPSLKNSPQARVAYYPCTYYLCATEKNSFKNSSQICAAVILTPDNSPRSCIATKSFRQKSYQSFRLFGRSAKYATILRTYSDNSLIIPCDYAASFSSGLFPIVLLLAQCRRIQSASLSLMCRRKTRRHAVCRIPFQQCRSRRNRQAATTNPLIRCGKHRRSGPQAAETPLNLHPHSHQTKRGGSLLAVKPRAKPLTGKAKHFGVRKPQDKPCNRRPYSDY